MCVLLSMAMEEFEMRLPIMERQVWGGVGDDSSSASSSGMSTLRWEWVRI